MAFEARSEVDIGDDGENAVIAQTRASDKARISVLGMLIRGVLAPELAQVGANALTLAEGFYVHTAGGEMLDRRLADFGLQRRAAESAYIVVRATRAPGVSGAITIPAGTRARARAIDGSPLDFSSRAEVVMAANANVADVLMDAAAAGAQYNVGSDTITELVDPIPGLPPNGLDPELPGITLTNLEAVTSGRDRDSDAQAREVFYSWLEARTRATPAALRIAALTYAETGPDGQPRYPILSASIEEHLEAPGAGGVAVTVYIVGHNGQFASAAQHAGVLARINGYVDAAGQEVEGWRAAGILVETKDPVLREVDVTIRLKLTERGSSNTVARLRADLTAKLAALPIGVALNLKGIFDSIVALGDEIENAHIAAPDDDVPVTLGQKIRLRTLTVLLI